MEEIKDTIEIKVRGYHLDVYGHVNNARYLEFLEEARWTLFEDDLLIWKKIGVSFFVVNINISYRASAELNTLLQIKSNMVEIKSRSCVLRQTVTEKETGTIVAEADVTFVIVDQSGKAVQIKDDTRDLIKKYFIEE